MDCLLKRLSDMLQKPSTIFSYPHLSKTKSQTRPHQFDLSGATEFIHYCRMLLTRHYDQRSFDETVWDAIIANGGVKNPSKRCKTFAMAEPSNTVQILVACAM